MWAYDSRYAKKAECQDGDAALALLSARRYVAIVLIPEGATRMAREPTDIVQIALRVREQLRRDVEELAQKSGRSLNGEIIRLIEQGMARRDTDALVMQAALAASTEAAMRLKEMLGPYLDRLARGNADNIESMAFRLKEMLSTNPNPPPPNDFVVQAMARAIEVMNTMVSEARTERIEARKERNAAQATVREANAPTLPLPMSSDFPK
jgi:hypothetical protein